MRTRHSMPRRLLAGAPAVACVAVLTACAAAPPGSPAARDSASAPTSCHVRVIAQFSPGVAQPGNATFLQELVQGTGYDLRFVRTLGTSVLLELTGADPDCSRGLAHLRANPLVKSLQVDARMHVPAPPSRSEAS